jgi:RHS repeat-associated protein
MKIYIHKPDEPAPYELTERVIYGSSRLGMNTKKADMLFPVSENVLSSYTGEKLYEMTNHLGNVLTVINDIKVPYESGGDILYYATITSTADYSPFGVTLDMDGGRTQYLTTGKRYRFAYQGSEQDDEVKGEGNSYTTYFRQLDPRIGRWFSLDPVVQPWQSPYCSMDDNPIVYNDQLGDKVKYRGPGRHKLRREVNYARKHDEAFAKWYDEKVKDEKTHYFRRSSQKIHKGTASNFRTLWMKGSNNSEDFVTIDDDGNETFGPDLEFGSRSKIRRWYFPKLDKSEKKSYIDPGGFTAGLRLWNIVVFDININSTGKFEDYFPGRHGKKDSFSFLHRVDKESIAYSSYPGALYTISGENYYFLHPLFIVTKRYGQFCFHSCSQHGMCGADFLNQLGPNEVYTHSRLRIMFDVIIHNIMRPYVYNL